ncbi:MAG: NAD(+)/NADH kinase [Planctomycetes bacterium]|nr:NAD(+)/NADH kinase [Planctomycetota bacterium]
MTDLKDKPVRLVVNPRSGAGGKKLLAADLRALMRSAGVNLVEYTTRAPQDATEYVRKTAGQTSAYVVWGGDGTVNEVASALAGSQVPILPCPVGTENLLANELKEPHELDKIVQTLLHGRCVNCDIGLINGRHFLLIIGIGFDGEVVRRLTACRTGHISHLSYFWPIWRTFWEHNYPRMRIALDGQTVFDDYGMAFVGNISRYASGLRICCDARYDDGLLDMVIYNCHEQRRLLMHIGFTLLRMHPQKGNVIYRRFKHAIIETDRPVPSQVDGDVGPDTPLDIKMLGAQVRIIVPPAPQKGLWARQKGSTNG